MNKETIKKNLELSSCRFDGIQRPVCRFGEMCWFTDMRTGSTHLLPVEDMTIEKISRHVEESRERFRRGNRGERIG